MISHRLVRVLRAGVRTMSSATSSSVEGEHNIAHDSAVLQQLYVLM
jgi:hypothetical protein